jgi:hypothetical protein
VLSSNPIILHCLIFQKLLYFALKVCDMNKKEAKKLINEQKRTLNSLPIKKTIQDQFWLDKTHMYITAIFGGSDRSLALPMFAPYYSVEENTANPTEVVIRLNVLFDTYIKIIDNNIYNKSNLFSERSNTSMVALLIAFMILIGSIGVIEGQRSASVDSKDQLKDIELLTDSLSTVKQSMFKYKYYYDSARSMKKSPVVAKKSKYKRRYIAPIY